MGMETVQKPKKKRRRKWSRTQRNAAIGAGIAAILGIVLWVWAEISYASDMKDHAGALTVTSEEEASALEGYTGRVLLEGVLTGTPYTFGEKYSGLELVETPEAEGSFLYTCMTVTRPEKYVKNSHEVELGREQPEYDYRDVDYAYYRQSDDLNIYGLPITMKDCGLIRPEDFGQLYFTLSERASLKGISAPEAQVAVVGELVNGELTNATVYVNGTIEEIQGDEKGSGVIIRVIALVWLALCAYAYWALAVYPRKNRR